MKVSNPVVRLHLVRERAHGGLRIRQWDTLADLGPGVHELYAGPAELEGVSEVLAEGAGFWRSCSGCHETEDGHPVGSYAYSSVLHCSLGSGCSECGGLGATWDNTDYDLIAHEDGLNDAAEVAAPFVPDGLAAALFNALEAYEAIRDSFPALRDKEIHIDQCRMLRQHASQLLEASRGDLLIAEQAVEPAND